MWSKKQCCWWETIQEIVLYYAVQFFIQIMFDTYLWPLVLIIFLICMWSFLLTFMVVWDTVWGDLSYVWIPDVLDLFAVEKWIVDWFVSYFSHCLNFGMTSLIRSESITFWVSTSLYRLFSNLLVANICMVRCFWKRFFRSAANPVTFVMLALQMEHSESRLDWVFFSHGWGKVATMYATNPKPCHLTNFRRACIWACFVDGGSSRTRQRMGQGT